MHVHEDGLRVNRWSMLYHHAMDRSVVQFHPEFRLLTDEELNEVKPFSSGNCRTDRIKSYVVKRFGDMAYSNNRHRVFDIIGGGTV